MSIHKLTQKQLKAIYTYNPHTGLFTNNKTNNVHDHMDSYGYNVIKIQGKSYKAHRLAWLYMKGKFPKSSIDHIDNNPGNNVFSNLRMANHSENGFNRKLGINNTSGIKGVHWNSSAKKWQCTIIVNYKHIYLGIFNDIEEAKRVIETARLFYHGTFARFK